jgi:hypothetical protein
MELLDRLGSCGMSRCHWPRGCRLPQLDTWIGWEADVLIWKRRCARLIISTLAAGVRMAWRRVSWRPLTWDFICIPMHAIAYPRRRLKILNTVWSEKRGARSWRLAQGTYCSVEYSCVCVCVSVWSLSTLYMSRPRADRLLAVAVAVVDVILARLKGPACVLRSPGSGETYSLAGRKLRLKKASFDYSSASSLKLLVFF